MKPEAEKLVGWMWNMYGHPINSPQDKWNSLCTMRGYIACMRDCCLIDRTEYEKLATEIQDVLLGD